MAYPYPIIRFRENGQAINRGCWWDGAVGRHTFQQTSEETSTIKLIFTDILDTSETITVTADDDGASATPAVDEGVVTLEVENVQGDALVDLIVTFSGGRVMKIPLRFTDPECWARRDYPPYDAVHVYS